VTRNVCTTPLDLELDLRERREGMIGKGRVSEKWQKGVGESRNVSRKFGSVEGREGGFFNFSS